MSIWTVNNKDYEIDIKVRDIFKMEKRGIDINNIVASMVREGKFPTMTQVLDIIQFGITEPKYRTNREALEDLYFEWIEEGHSPIDIYELFATILTDSGIIGNANEGNEEDAKN